ncbi:hypothetical protein HMPREF0004_2271 [Achromobacter piechaudii ATCC 43553]|uniref:Uncharacterized protein n=1 Tax=Achromobacter piechaudii ATCC 43553 TaxID=742159 RepID=D4X9X4_9BURK|nr:hypothetical protein HMPREF0004_2271 [Achromobacter piechaudii ATCC 43553]
MWVHAPIMLPKVGMKKAQIGEKYTITVAKSSVCFGTEKRRVWLLRKAGRA